MGAQSKERKGSNFAAQRSGAIVPQAQRAKHIRSKNMATAIWQPWREGEKRQKILTSHVGSGEVREMHLAGGDRPGPRLFEIRARRWRTGHFLVTLDDDDGDGDDDLR